MNNNKEEKIDINFSENKEENINIKEQENFEKDKNNTMTKNNSSDKIREIKKINKPNLNYDYGDSMNSIIINEITNSNIKYNIANTNKKINEVINNNKYNKDKSSNTNDINTDKIINIKYESFTTKNNYSNETKPYYNLYNEFKMKYKNNNENKTLENTGLIERNYLTNYINTTAKRNYLTLEPHYSSNKLSYNTIDKEIKTPLRDEYENKTNNINLNFTEYKINSFTPDRYISLNNNKSDIDSSKVIYLENKIAQQQKLLEKYKNDIYINMNEIKMYKNSFKIIKEFFDGLSKKFNHEFIQKDKMSEINDENALSVYFKNLEEYIINLNKQINDYKYKYQKLLDLDSSIHSTINKENHNKEILIENNTFSENNENTNEKNNNYFYYMNSNNELEMYKTLEKRVFLLEKELFNKNYQGKSIKIRNKSTPKIRIKKAKTKKIEETKEDNYNINKNEKVNKKNNMIRLIKNPKLSLSNKSKITTKNKIYRSCKCKKK